MDLDTADLLGNKDLPLIKDSSEAPYFSNSMWLVILACIGILGRWFLRDFTGFFSNWQEQRYRRRIRRKHGIPDNDTRPFNIAYAAAVRRKQEEELQERRRQEQELRQRHQAAVAQASQGTDSGASKPAFTNENQNGLTNRRDKLMSQPDVSQVGSGRSQDRSAQQNSNAQIGGQSNRRLQRHNAFEGTQNIPGPSALQDDNVPSQRKVSGPKHTRGSKRQAEADDDEAMNMPRKKGRDRKSRKSTQHPKDSADVGSDEERDELMDLDPAARGKKRDRAEAGSTFGGDESPDSDEKKVRRRRRRGAGREESEQRPRGEKRTLDLESTLDSDEDVPESGRKHAMKRGRHNRVQEDVDLTDVSFEDPHLSKDPSCKGRRIGEEWESHGEHFKVGPDGKRLRQVLIKKRRSRYSMPQDSQHPDTQAQLAVVVETWMNEEDYKAAEERGDIYKVMEPVKEVQVASPPKGKPLLWSSPRKSLPALPRSAFKDSRVTNVAPLVNPFEMEAPTSSSRRISSGFMRTSLSGSDISNLRSSKSYSKWEKQELEAEAMAKIKKRMDEQKKATEKAAAEAQKSLLPPAAPATLSFSTPTTTIAAPVAIAATPGTDKSASNLFSPPVSTEAKPAASTVAPSAPPAVPSMPSMPSFSLPAAPKPPTASEKPTNMPSFSFGAPTVQPPAAVNGEAPKMAGSTTVNASSQGKSPFAFPTATPTPGFSSSSSAPSATSDPAKAVQNPTTSAGSVPNFFAKPAGATPSAFTFGPSSATSAESGNKVAGNAPSAFAPAAPSSASDASNPFSIKGAAQMKSGESQSSAPKPFFRFGATSNAPSVPSPLSNESRQAPTAEPAKESQPGSSLLSRVGSFAPPSNLSTSTSGPAASQPPSQPPSIFGAPSSAAPPKDEGHKATADPSNADKSASSAFKFNFGGMAKPAAPLFGQNTTTTEPTKPAAVTTPSSTPTFKFMVTPPQQSSTTPLATPPSGSPFTFGSSTTPSKPATGSTFGSTTPTTSPFSFGGGSSNAATKPLAFGGSSGPGTNTNAAMAAPGTSSGADAAKPSGGDAPKPLFGFGSNGAPGPFAFGGGASSASSQSTGTSGNIFGSTGASNTAPASNPFGFKPSGPTTSPFTFGASSNTGSAGAENNKTQ